MGNLNHARNVRELVVYQKSRAVSKCIFELSKRLPKDEMYSLTDQLRRSSRSIGAQICEVWAKRRFERHFISKLTDADAEQHETQHWIETACDCKYLQPEEALSLCQQLTEIGRMLNAMIEKADQFCGVSPRVVREPEMDYPAIFAPVATLADH